MNILDKSAFTSIVLFYTILYVCKMIIVLIENQDTTVILVIIVANNTRANLIKNILIKSNSPSYLKIDHTHNMVLVLMEIIVGNTSLLFCMWRKHMFPINQCVKMTNICVFVFILYLVQSVTLFIHRHRIGKMVNISILICILFLVQPVISIYILNGKSCVKVLDLNFHVRTHWSRQNNIKK